MKINDIEEDTAYSGIWKALVIYWQYEIEIRTKYIRKQHTEQRVNKDKAITNNNHYILYLMIGYVSKMTQQNFFDILWV